ARCGRCRRPATWRRSRDTIPFEASTWLPPSFASRLLLSQLQFPSWGRELPHRLGLHRGSPSKSASFVRLLTPFPSTPTEYTSSCAQYASRVPSADQEMYLHSS